VRAVGETHVACISEENNPNRDIFLYNAITGDHEKTIRGENCMGVLAISNKRNELICLRQSGESNVESTIGVYRLRMLPRPTYTLTKLKCSTYNREELILPRSVPTFLRFLGADRHHSGLKSTLKLFCSVHKSLQIRPLTGHRLRHPST
jgi:hypothetical protein